MTTIAPQLHLPEIQSLEQVLSRLNPDELAIELASWREQLGQKANPGSQIDCIAVEIP